MLATAAGLVAYSGRKIRLEGDESKTPLMGVLGAFIFSAQMINFAIPGTGSSGHLAGALLLAILLGPHAAFVAIASVLTIQALFFADGGLLALGCNIMNMGFFACFIAYPFVYRPLAGENPSRGRLMAASVFSAVVSLGLGALAVTVETVLSGVSALPFLNFALLMLPIHLAIGLVEGLVTFAVISFVRKSRPELFASPKALATPPISMRGVIVSFAVLAIVSAGALSWFASTRPDGLEWAILKITGQPELAEPAEGVRAGARRIQETTAFLPDYDFKPGPLESLSSAPANEEAGMVNMGASLAGIVGAGLTLGLTGLIGLGLRLRRSEL